MNKKEGTIKDRIIKAAFKIIKQEGIENVTIRKITKIADVNVSAINYYFGCKENIVNEVIKISLNSIVNIFDILEDEDISCRDRLKEFLTTYSDNATIYPLFNKNILEKLINDTINEEVYLILRERFERLKSVLAEFIQSEDDMVLCMKMIQIMSGIIYPALIHEKTLDVFGFDYLDKDCREKYIDLLLDNLG